MISIVQDEEILSKLYDGYILQTDDFKYKYVLIHPTTRQNIQVFGSQIEKLIDRGLLKRTITHFGLAEITLSENPINDKEKENNNQ